MLVMTPPDTRCTIGTNIEAKAVLITSLYECSIQYRYNKKTRIFVVTVLAVEIGPNATTSGRSRTFFIAKFDLDGGEMKVSTINITSVRIHTLEPLSPDTDGNGE